MFHAKVCGHVHQGQPSPNVQDLQNGSGTECKPDLVGELKRELVTHQVSSKCTLLQKVSKCEVKEARYGSFTIFLPLRFYMKSNFNDLKRSKNVIFGHFQRF